MARPCSAIYLLSRVGRRKAKLKEHAMRTSQNTAETINTIGIDVGKNTFHLVGLDKRGAIVLQQKVSRLPHKCCEWSTRVLAPPLAHRTDDRAEVATLCGEDVLGPRGTHRIEAPLDNAILLKRPQTLR